MAKLYAEITSDKGGRVASKSGDETITVTLYAGNIEVAQIEFWPSKHADLWQNTIKVKERCHAVDTLVIKHS